MLFTPIYLTPHYKYISAMSVQQHIINDMIIVEQEKSNYEVTNFKHSDPSEHRYIVVDNEKSPFCNCKAFKYNSGDCKHIEAVNQFKW